MKLTMETDVRHHLISNAGYEAMKEIRRVIESRNLSIQEASGILESLIYDMQRTVRMATQISYGGLKKYVDTVSRGDAETNQAGEAARQRQTAANDIDNSSEAETSESAISPVYPGWPPAEPQEHEQPWPRYGAPHPSARVPKTEN